MSLRSSLTLILLAAFTVLAAAAQPPDFSGTWVLNPARSKNLGMMSAMRDTVTITQTPTLLVTRDDAEFQGKPMPPHVIRYALDGASVANTSPTGDPAHTVSSWRANQLITVWSTPGSIAGTVHQRTERRFLSPDGRTMTVVSSSGAQDPAPLTMIFDRK